jgi:hypothetical protein
MILTLPPPPRLPAHTWRPLCREDAAALLQLEVDCAPIDGGTSIASSVERKAKLEEIGDKLSIDTLCEGDCTGRLKAHPLQR